MYLLGAKNGGERGRRTMFYLREHKALPCALHVPPSPLVGHHEVGPKVIGIL